MPDREMTDEHDRQNVRNYRNGRPDEAINRLMRLMTHGRIRRLPVMKNRQLGGIVSLGDFVQYRLAEFEMKSNVLRDICISAR